ncbi:hypothetical protein HU200_012203 [Digitaria exilis]|uniref:Protein kinase domain-containing protein n=1 Tax=Digitaria exilis TaxID=1010633 RepID=A0A835FF41_9POAL|nr:hypothetical protein HU200_012203 [Digitaria exilis]
MDGNASTAYNVLERMVLDESEEPRSLPLSLLETITNNFSDEMKLGSGGFAVVYKGVLGSRAVAVKLLCGAMNLDEKQFIKEVQCLMKVRHKNIVRLLGYCADTQGLMINFEGKSVMADVRNRALCFEYVSNGSLDNFITDASRGLEWRVRYKVIKGICEGLHYLHENRILHLDLKPSNILVDGNMVPKIADFGLSRIFDEDQSKIITTKLIGSVGYLAPEFYSKEITLKLDIYSLGVVIMEILTGEKGFSSAEKVIESWRNRLELSHGDDEQVRVCAEIGMQCMEADRDKRPTTQDIIKMFIELGGTSSEEHVSLQESTNINFLHTSSQFFSEVVMQCILPCLHL